MRLSWLLRVWRQKNRLTLRAAAKAIGLHPSTLARLERGEQMHGATLATVLVWLMGREEPSKNEAFAFEAKVAIEAEESEGDRERGGREEAELAIDTEAHRAPGAAIEDEQKEAKEPALLAVD